MRSDFATCLARRGRRYPAAAPDGAVGAARRLPCAARSRAAPHNSLRSPRSLRSDRCGESVHEARGIRAPALALRCSAPHRLPPPGTACREPHRSLPPGDAPPWLPSRCGVAGRRPVGAAEKHSAPGRARTRAPRHLTRGRLSERSERSERRELGRGPGARASQGTRAQRGPASGPAAGHPAVAARFTARATTVRHTPC